MLFDRESPPTLGDARGDLLRYLRIWTWVSRGLVLVSLTYLGLEWLWTHRLYRVHLIGHQMPLELRILSTFTLELLLLPFGMLLVEVVMFLTTLYLPVPKQVGRFLVSATLFAGTCLWTIWMVGSAMAGLR